MPAAKILSGYAQGLRWKWLAIVLMAFIALIFFLNFQIKVDFTIILVLILVAMFVVIIWLLRRESKPDLVDFITAAKITKDILGEQYPEQGHTNANLKQTHGRPVFERIFLIQFDDISQVFIFDRQDKQILGMAAPDIDRVEQKMLANELLRSSFAKEIKGEQVKEVVQKMMGEEQ